MKGHTQGPWVVETGKPLMVVAEHGGFAVIVSEVGRRPSAQDVSNACLIASAPELLEALRALLSYCSQLELVCYPDDDGATHDVVAKAQQALAKAEGR